MPSISSTRLPMPSLSHLKIHVSKRIGPGAESAAVFRSSIFFRQASTDSKSRLALSSLQDAFEDSTESCQEGPTVYNESAPCSKLIKYHEKGYLRRLLKFPFTDGRTGNVAPRFCEAQASRSLLTLQVIKPVHMEETVQPIDAWHPAKT